MIERKDFTKTLNVLRFNEIGFYSMMNIKGITNAIVLLLISVLFQSMPTSYDEIFVFFNMYIFYLIKFLIILIIIILFYKSMGGKTEIDTFISVTSLTYTYAMIVSMITAYMSLLIFDYLLKISVVSGVVTSFIPYYTSVLFGWATENACGINNKRKAIIVGLFSITLLIIYIIYIDQILCQIGFTKLFGIEKLFCEGI